MQARLRLLQTRPGSNFREKKEFPAISRPHQKRWRAQINFTAKRPKQISDSRPKPRSQAGREAQKLPRQFEAFRKMRGERFDAECFSRVMAAENKIDSKLLRRDGSPVRCFAGN